MKNNPLKDLILINLSYANPALNTQMKKKKKYQLNPDALLTDYAKNLVIKMNLFNAFIFIVLFASIDFRIFPGFLDITLIFFILFAVFQDLSIFYNVFYENTSLEDFMSLPIESRTLYLGKMISALLASFGSFFMIFAPILHFYRQNMSLAVAIPSALIFGLLLWALENLLSLLIVTYVASFSCSKKLITILNTLSLIAYFIFLIAFSTLKKALPMSSVPGPVSGLMLTQKGSAGLFVLLLLVDVLLYRCTLHIGSKYFLQVQTTTKKGSSSFKTPGDLSSALFTYNMSLIKKQVIFINSILMPVIFPVAIITPMAINTMDMFSTLPSLSVALVLGFTFPLYLNGFPTTLPSVIVSLEGRDHLFIRSLPISEKQYYAAKLKTVFLCYNTLPMVLLFGILLFLKMPLPGILLALIVCGSMCTGFDKLWIMFDVRHLSTDWQNESDLFLRLSSVLKMVYMAGAFMISAICFAMLFLNITFFPCVLALVVVVFNIFCHLNFQHFLRTVSK